MKKILILITALLLNTLFVYSSSIVVNGTLIYVTTSTTPPHSSVYSYKLGKYSQAEYNIIIDKLEKELSKYPKNVLKKYGPTKIYIVDDIYSTKHFNVNGVSINNSIILKKDVLIGGISMYLIKVLHHEMFHQLTKLYNKKVYHLYNELNKNCNYKYTGSDVEENNVYTFNSEFISTYHPNASETAAEIFAYLMYPSELNPHTTQVILWYKSNESNTNIKLKKNIAAVINYTAAISNNIMNKFYYLDLIKRL